MNPATLSSSPSIETVFETMSERRKRHALYVLRWSEGGALTVERLAQQMVRMDDGSGPADGEEPGRIAADLRRRVVPELAATGAVEYDERSDTVRYHTVPSLEEWLEHAAYREGRHPGC